MISEQHRAVIRQGRIWFGKQLANLLRFRQEFTEFVGSSDVVRALERILGYVVSILFTEMSITSLMGVFSAGKTALINLHLSESLPSGQSPTSRLYAIIEPSKEVDKPKYFVGVLGQIEARRCLALIAEKLKDELGVLAKAAIAKGESVRDAARNLYRCCIDNFALVLGDKDREKIAVDAAFLSRSIHMHLGENESLTVRALVDNDRFNAKEQAAQYVAWHDDLKFDLGNPRDGAAVEQTLDAWFSGDRWSEFAQRNLHRTDLGNLSEIYQIGMKLGVLGFLWCQVPESEALQAGYLYADAPGRGGTSLLDTIMGDIVLLSASAGNLVIKIDRDRGGDQRTLENELASMPCGRSYNFGDALLTTVDDGLAGAVTDLADDAKSLAAAQKIVAKFKNKLDLDQPQSPNYKRLDSDNPNHTSLLQVTFAKFGKEPHATEACKSLRTLARWLGDRQTLDCLPAHLQHIVAQYAGQALPGTLRDIDDRLPARVVARLMAILVALGHDGARSSMGPLLREVQRDIDRARFDKWSANAGKLQELVAGFEHFAVEDVPGLVLGREDKQEILALSQAIQSAVAVTKQLIHQQLGLPHFYAPLDEPVRTHLVDLCRHGSRQLAADAGRKPLQQAFVDLFRQVVQQMPHRLDVSIDDAVAGYLDHLQKLVPEDRFAFGDPAQPPTNGNGKAKNGKPAPPETLKGKIVAALLPASSMWRCEQLRPRLRRNADECIEQCWSQALLANSPMLSIPNEPFDRDVHPGKFERIALRVGEHVMATALLAAARDILRTTRDHLLDWLTRLEARTSYPALVEQALLASADTGQAVALRRKALAGQAFQEFQRELSPMLGQLCQALEPGHSNGQPVGAVSPGPAGPSPLPTEENAHV